MIGVVVPVKYKWWNVPGTPPNKNKAADAIEEPVAIFLLTKPKL